MNLQAEQASHYRWWTRTNFKYLLLVLIVGFQCIYWGLATKPIYKTQEIRVAETAREMVDTGEWIVPYFNGELRLRKPPLAYWLTAASYKAFGNVNEFTARFASAGFALLGSALLFFWVQRALNTSAAFATLACFLSSYIALRYFRSGETDATLLFFVTASCMLVYRLLHGKATLTTIVALHLSMGLGFLTKGPAAIVMPLAVFVFYAIRQHRFKDFRKAAHPLGIAVFLVTAFAWYGVILFKLPDVAAYWIGEEVDATYLGGRRPNPIYWYVPGLFKFFAPWSLFIIPAGIWFYRTRPHPPLVRFALIWFALTFVILSLNITKQTQYALLLNPPLAILLGHYLACAQRRYALFNRVSLVSLIVIVGVGAMAFLRSKYAIPMDWSTALLLAAGASAPALFARISGVADFRALLPLLLAGVMAAGWVHVQHFLYDAQSDETRNKRFALRIKDYAPIYMYEQQNVRISFYTERVVKTLGRETLAQTLRQTANPIYLVTRDGDDTVGLGQHKAHKLFDSDGFALWQVPPATVPSADVSHQRRTRMVESSPYSRRERSVLDVPLLGILFLKLQGP